MSGEGIFCTNCGITLRSFMKVCPRCGDVREEAALLDPAPISSSASSHPNPTTAPIGAIRQEAALPNDVVFLSPKEIQRRFPLLTSAQLTLIAIGCGLLILMSAIAYLLWNRQSRDLLQKASNAAVTARPTPAVSPTQEPSPTPTPIDDQSVSESVKSALIAYNPLGFARYTFEVKDGVVTLGGEAAHQPEKEGAENVVKMVNGVKSVVNSLKVKPNQAIIPVNVNQAEARILDEALKKQVQTEEQAQKQSPSDPQREAERQRREQVAAKQREEELASRKAAEEKIRRETEEYEKRQEELRRADAERRARAEQAKLEASVLRSGTVAWSGIIDGIGEVIFSGSSSSVRHLSGATPREVRVSFSAPIPRSPLSVVLISIDGRGPAQIVQQPSATNGYATIVRIDDSAKGGEKRYEFTLKWTLQ